MIRLVLLPAAAFGSTIPLVPDADQAREWARQELSRSVYQEAQPGLLDRFWQWLGEFFTNLLNSVSGLDPRAGVLLLALGAAAVLAAAVFLVRPRLNARKQREIFESGDVLVAVDHRRLSEEAAARGEWNTAVAERLRAMIRSAEERVVLDPRPGRTVAEAGQCLAAAFPAFTPEIFWLTVRFDEIRYGHLPATSADAVRAQDLDQALERTLPSEAARSSSLAVPR